VQADIQREWNTYGLEEIISAFTIVPLIPYWYAATGLCEGYDPENWNENCPEDWQKDVWELFEEEREEERGSKRDKKGGDKKKPMKKDGDKKKERKEEVENWENEQADVADPNGDAVIDADELVDPLTL
jgi:hypothetical protein